MKKSAATFWAIGIICIVIGARRASIQVDASYDKSSDFTKYKTFDWYPSKEKGNVKYFRNLRIRDEIRADVKTELEARGIHLDSKNPDLLVEYQGALNSAPCRKPVDAIEERDPRLLPLNNFMRPC